MVTSSLAGFQARLKDPPFPQLKVTVDNPSKNGGTKVSRCKSRFERSCHIVASNIGNSCGNIDV